MKVTYQSEYLPLESIFIKTVEAAFVSNENMDGQWKSLNYINRPEYHLAINEYNEFENYLKKQSSKIYTFPQNNNVTMDSIYCRDASIATDFGMIICNMGKSGRVNEPFAQKLIFEQYQIPILGEIQLPGTLEGGDVAWIDQNTLAVGHTYRTNQEGIKQLKQLVEPNGVEVIVADLPHYKGPEDVFHLMSIFSPIDKDLAVVYSPLMPISFRNILKERGYSFIEVPKSEFESMGCNVFAIGPRKCMMVRGNPKTESLLKSAGCEVFAYDGDHISLPGGGGPTCLTRPLLRRSQTN